MAETATDKRPAGNVAEFSVTELAGAIKRSLEDGFGYVRLRGEISGFRGRHASGHCYFALKDERAKIDAVIWRGSYSKLKFKPEEGIEVIAHGRVTTYPNSSKYQIVIEALEPAGVGALMALLEERKKKFTAAGLFDEARKKRLPFLPKVVGIVTSPTGAVIRDMLHGFNERYPTHVLVWPVRVQGETSASEVAAAVTGFNALAPSGIIPRPDVLIVARGGGSLEDLWSFNEEASVLAVAKSDIPVISAVGHETDWTLIDLAADARAPTPTKAAEWAVPNHRELIEQNEEFDTRLKHAARRTIDTARSNLRAASRGLPQVQDLVALPRQRFDATERRLGTALLGNTRALAIRLTRIATRLTPTLLKNRMERARERLDRHAAKTQDALRQIAHKRRNSWTRIAAGLNPELIRLRQTKAADRFSNLAARLDRAYTEHVRTARGTLETQSKLLTSLGYQNVLKRGFALVRTQDGDMVRAIEALQKDTRVTVEFQDGIVAGILSPLSTEPANPPPTSSETSAHSQPEKQSKSKSKRSPGGGSSSQGTLF